MESVSCEEINRLIEENQCFALYRLPDDPSIHYIIQHSKEVELIDHLDDLNGKEGFVIAPFQINDQHPIVLVHPERHGLVNVTADLGSEKNHDCDSIDEQQAVSTTYAQRFERFKLCLKNKELKKIVLSRSISLPRTEHFSPALTFCKAERRYVHSFVYLLHTPQTGIWIGGTPEILLSGKGNEWKTVALAGTQPIVKGQLPDSWDEKNRKEQLVVANYILDQLRSIQIEPQVNSPHTIQAGELAHLRTDFQFHLGDTSRLGSILSLLHPTPAVCGLPKDDAFHFILQNEGYTRGYYSGFVGTIRPEEQSDIYVNLRCMQASKNTLTLFAGGGLLEASILEDEWMETEEKLQTMRRLLHY